LWYTYLNVILCINNCIIITYKGFFIFVVLSRTMTILEILTPIAQFIMSIISDLGYGGIFLLMLLEGALIPIPSEIIMPFSGFLVTTGSLGSIGVILAGSLVVDNDYSVCYLDPL
jgi:hypothetical protein